MIDYSAQIKKAESDYKDYCEGLVQRLNVEIKAAGVYCYSESYRKAKEVFDSDPVRRSMMDAIGKMYFINPNPNPIVINPGS